MRSAANLLRKLHSGRSSMGAALRRHTPEIDTRIGQLACMLSILESAIVMQDLQPDVAMLKAEVLVEASPGEQILKYFPVSRLSKVPEQRFAQLFQARARWRLDELEPFLQGLQVCKMHHDRATWIR